MNGHGVNAIIEAARQAAGIEEPKVIEGPGFRKLAVESLTTEEGGLAQRTYTLTDLPQSEPRPAALKVHTLTGLIDYIRANRDGIKLEEAVVHIVDHTKVQLISKTSGSFHQRTVYAEATYQELTPAGDPPFRYGQFAKAEDFNIALQALFVDSDDRRRVLEVIGNAKRASAVKLSDDGIAQAVFAESGVSLGNDVKIPNPVLLAPWRTFREVEQPLSKFVLRAKGGPEELPVLALFEADGGAWKLEAIEWIKTFLRIRLAAPGEGPAAQRETIVAIVA